MIYETCEICPVADRCKILSGGTQAKWSTCTPYKLVRMFQEAATIDTVHRDLTFSTHPPTHQSAKRLVSMMLAEGMENLGRFDNIYLHGDAGTGKTTLAATILNEYIIETLRHVRGAEKASSLCYFVSGDELVSELKSNLYDPQFNEYLDEIRKTPVLVFDDISAIRFTPFALDILYRIFNYRINHKLTSIVTSNIDPDELSNVIDPYLASRVTAFAYYVGMNGEDMRKGMRL